MNDDDERKKKVFEDLDATRRFAISDGDFVPISNDSPDEVNGMPLEAAFNILQSTHLDVAGHPLRGSSNFPDGHLFSPFKPRTWKFVSKDELFQHLAEKDRGAFEEVRRLDQERREKYARQSGEWFEAMGRYCVAFEQLCASLIRLVRQLMKRNGLRDRDVTDIVVADLVASQVVTLAQTLFNATEVDDVDRKIAEKIFARVGVCCTSRNEVIHAAWLPGGANAWSADDFSVARGLRYVKKPTDGSAVRQLLYGKTELEWLRQHCENTTVLVDDIKFSVMKKMPLSYWLVPVGKLIRRALLMSSDPNDLYIEDYPPVERYPPDNGATDCAIGKSSGERIIAARHEDVDDLHFELGIHDKMKQERKEKKK